MTTLGKATLFVALVLGYAQVENKDLIEFRYGVLTTTLMFILIGSPLINLVRCACYRFSHGIVYLNIDDVFLILGRDYKNEEHGNPTIPPDLHGNPGLIPMATLWPHNRQSFRNSKCFLLLHIPVYATALNLIS